MSTPPDILLVEDEGAIAEALRRMLLRAGYIVRTAKDGVEALAELGQRLPSVLILDLILPGVSGYAILEHIHEHQMLLPIIIITANPLYHDSLHHAGIRHVLIKPFHIVELLAALRTLIGFS
jgi:DNA-binding response OmpR family regulator